MLLLAMLFVASYAEETQVQDLEPAEGKSKGHMGSYGGYGGYGQGNAL